MKNKLIPYIIIGILVIAGVVGASLYFVKKQSPPSPVEQQAPIATPPEAQEKVPSEKAPADGTANWKTYRNEKYGFEIKYPPGFFYSEENEGVRFIENEWENITGNFPYIGIDILQTTSSIEDFFKEEKKRLVNEGYRFFENGCDMRCVSKQAKEIVVVKEIKALKYRVWGVSGGNDNVIIRHPSRDLIIKIYKHISGWGEKGTYSENGVIPDEIFNKMLSTLRFY
jgi:hypothetical protein